MPPLKSRMHINMLENEKQNDKIYGLQWGDPNKSSQLRLVKQHYLSYYINNDANVVEIGPGGGRWTRYMLDCNHVYAIDYHRQLLDELKKNYNRDNITFIKNNGADFPDVPDAEIDFIFSYGVFVHLDIDIIDAYLGNMKRLLKPTSNVIIHYSDKTKPHGQHNKGFSDNTPERMLALVRQHGYVVQDDNRWLLRNAAIVRFTLPGNLTESKRKRSRQSSRTASKTLTSAQ